MSKWLKASIGPALVILAVAAIYALAHFGVIDLSTIALPQSPELQQFSADLPAIGLAFLFGMLGAFVRGGSSAGKLSERLRRLAIGGVVGVIVFFILKSEVIPHVIYDNLPPEDLDVSFYGLALLAVFGGMYGSELTRWARGGS